MAKSLFTLVEDPDSVPCTHVTANNCLQVQDQEIWPLPLASMDTKHVCGSYTYIQTKHRFT